MACSIKQLNEMPNMMLPYNLQQMERENEIYRNYLASADVVAVKTMSGFLPESACVNQTREKKQKE